MADDLFEPYRPYVDWRVRLLADGDGPVPELSESGTRAALLALFNETVQVDNRRMPLLYAIQIGAASLSRALTGGATKLLLPEGLPLESGPTDHDGED